MLRLLRRGVLLLTQPDYFSVLSGQIPFTDKSKLTGLRQRAGMEAAAGAQRRRAGDVGRAHLFEVDVRHGG